MLIEGKHSENINSLVWQYASPALSNSIFLCPILEFLCWLSKIPYDAADFVSICWQFLFPLLMICVLLAITPIISLNVWILTNTWHPRAKTKADICFQKCKHSSTEREDWQILLEFFYIYSDFKCLKFIIPSVCKTALRHLVSCYILSKWTMQLCLLNLINRNFFPTFFYYSPNSSWNCCHYLD